MNLNCSSLDFPVEKCKLLLFFVDKNVKNFTFSWIKMYRTKLEELKKRKNSKNRKPLIVQ
jgi:hypothetical protein